MKEGFAAEHTCEILSHSLEHFLDGGRVACESNSHLQALWRNIANASLDIVRDPLHKVRRVFVLNIEHLFVNLLGAHASTEKSRSCQVTSVTRICGAHHVLGIE